MQGNIEIMRTFVRLRQMLAVHKGLERKLTALEKKYDEQFKIVFEAIRQLMTSPDENKKKKEKNPEHPVYPVKKDFL